jgi:type VI secretion system protein ImpK
MSAGRVPGGRRRLANRIILWDGEGSIMRDEVHELVYPVLRYGLDLKERLGRGEEADLEKSQLDLKRLLADKRWNELGGEAGALEASAFSASRSVAGTPLRGTTSFLGIRYAITCWLDEIFVLDSPWGAQWNERTLEVALYGTRDRAFAFWEQAEKAESRPGSEALEVYYLCVMLGFRGDFRDRPDRLRAWVQRVQPQIIRSHGQEPPQVDKSTPVNNVPLLTGRDRFQAMFKAWGGVLLLLVFVLGFLLIYKLV